MSRSDLLPEHHATAIFLGSFSTQQCAHTGRMSTHPLSSGLYLSQFADGKRCEDVSMVSNTAEATEDTPTTEAPFDLDATLRAHYPRITRVIARVVKDPARAEELAVDVFVRLWREPKAHGGQTPGWLYRTAVRHGLDDLRRVTRRARYEPLLRLAGGGSSPEEAAAAGQEHGRVRLTLLALRRGQAMLLVLRGHGLSYDELADAAGVTPSSVGTLLRRAREAFRKEYISRYGDTR